MNKSKIEYVDHTLNILTGCNHGCPYCYARTMTQRFSGNIKRHLTLTDQYRKEGELYILDEPFIDESGNQVIYPFGFAPTYHRYRIGSVLDKLKMGQNIFVGAMADMCGEWVPEYVANEIFADCMAHPKNNYLFLTKNPQRYADYGLPDNENYFYGTTITREDEFFRIGLLPKAGKRFVCFEPLLENVSSALSQPWIAERLRDLEWIIIGAETGRRKEKVIPEREWVNQITEIADSAKIPVFMKDSLISIVGEKNMRRDYPEQLTRKPLSDKVLKLRNDLCMECGKALPKNKMVTLIARAQRGGSTTTIGYMCSTCFREWVGSHNLTVPELEGME